MDEPPSRHSPSVGQLSKTPSWVMLGFILGALVVWALPRRTPSPPPVAAVPAAQRPARPAEPPLLTTVEAVFGDWSEYAVWDGDVTQVALWNAAVGEFAEFYEVRRVDGTNYFRSLPRLTNRVVRHGKEPPPECPLRFTETEQQYREWREHGRIERPLESAAPSVSIPHGVPVPPRPSGMRVAPSMPPPELAPSPGLRTEDALAEKNHPPAK